jgi:hypothetical protein
MREGRILMNKQHDDYKMVLYPKLRRALALTLRSAQSKPMIHGLIEVGGESLICFSTEKQLLDAETSTS